MFGMAADNPRARTGWYLCDDDADDDPRYMVCVHWDESDDVIGAHMTRVCLAVFVSGALDGYCWERLHLFSIYICCVNAGWVHYCATTAGRNKRVDNHLFAISGTATPTPREYTIQDVVIVNALLLCIGKVPSKNYGVPRRVNARARVSAVTFHMSVSDMSIWTH